MTTKKIFFDLDGTLYNLYNIEGWLDYLENEKAEVFSIGDFIVNYDEFLVEIYRLLNKGYTFGVITWLPMEREGVNQDKFNKECEIQKIKWVKKYLPFVNEINCQRYGTPKAKAIKIKSDEMILIDDNKGVCEVWEKSKNCKAINLNSEINVLKALKML